MAVVGTLELLAYAAAPAGASALGGTRLVLALALGLEALFLNLSAVGGGPGGRRAAATCAAPADGPQERDRVFALISIVGIALLIFGLIEAQTRAALGPDQQLLGLLLAAFQDLGLTYTHNGIALDQLTDTQRHVLELVNIQPPWPQHLGPPHRQLSRFRGVGRSLCPIA